MSFKRVDPNWKEKYPFLGSFYRNEYDPKYYEFDKYELQIDPLETKEEIEAYSTRIQKQEILKCAAFFPYFCHKYVKIRRPEQDLVPFILHNCQRSCVKAYENNNFSIFSKFRQGGFSTLNAIYSLWRFSFKPDETISIMVRHERECLDIENIIKYALEALPAWMKPEMYVRPKNFCNINTDSRLFILNSHTLSPGCSIDYLFMEEVAFISKMDECWKSLLPIISKNGHCACFSTPNGKNNWFHNVFTNAKRHGFKKFKLDYRDDPNNKDRVKQLKAGLGQKGWQQEYLCKFLD
jgi:hypothetical protein